MQQRTRRTQRAVGNLARNASMRTHTPQNSQNEASFEVSRGYCL